MTIRIDAHELYQVLDLTPPEHNILLIGKHGIGKSEIITHFYRQKRQMPVIVFFLGQMSDPGDLIGLFHKDENTGRSVFLPPYWWPDSHQAVVLFLDELNRARPEILQAVQDLALNRTLAGKHLPAGSIIIAAVNEGDEYQLTELDPALVSRFNLYEFVPTVEDWLLWASQQGLDARVIGFIQQHPEHLDSPSLSNEDTTAVAGLIKTPDRRAWAKVAQFIHPHEQLEDIHYKIIAGMVGARASLAFRQSFASQSLLSPEQLLFEFSRHRNKLKTYEIHHLVTLNESILLWLNANHCPKNRADSARKNLLAYLQYLQKSKYQEAIAHFASLVQSPKFAIVMSFVAESLDLVDFLSDYLEGIRV